jgi:fructose 1,6-bisphosphate aldolase/phosphatase
MPSTQTIFPALTKDDFLAQERERVPKRVTMTMMSANALRWLGGLSTIPNEVLEAGRTVLCRAQQDGAIRDYRLYALGSDLVMQIMTLGQGLHNSKVCALASEVVTTALTCAAEAHVYHAIPGEGDFFHLTPRQRVAALRLRPLEFPFTERGAEPIVIAKVVNGAAGAFNRMLFNLFFHPDKGSHQRLDGTRFIAVVENVADLTAGKVQRRLFAFGDRPLEERLLLLYPWLQEPLELCRDQIGDWAELLSLIANPVEWVVSGIYAVQGRFVTDGERLQATRHEPVALVSIETLGATAVEDPVAIVRLQGGLPAVGEAHFNLGADFHFTIGGPGSGYHMGVMPVTMAQVRNRTDEQGTAKIVAYTYQSYDNGCIPPEHDVVDLFAQDSVQTALLQHEAREAIQCMVQHGEFQPYVTAEEAERRARACAERLGRWFESIPSAEEGEVDPLVQQANARAGGETLSDIKADAGGKVGHTTPPTLFEPVARASLCESQEAGLIRSFQVFGVGDDLHLLMAHNQGVDANQIHLMAFQTFWRLVWVTELIGYKPYGLAQDLKIGPATKGARVDDLAQPSARFIELLATHLPEPEQGHLDKIRQAQEAWQGGRGTVEIKKPFAGNVTGQGPGFAELPLRNTWRVGVLAADKAGPAAFNVPVYRAVERALAQEHFRARYGDSLAFEIFDVHEHRRIFLDARAHREEIATLLGATNLFNVKRLWSLPQTISQPEAVKGAMQDILLAASTEKLALITGGEYVGKDDPVLLGVEELVTPMFEYMQTGFYMTQGDERGSHYMMLLPKPLTESVATVRSRGLQIGLMVTLNARGITETHDVFAEPSYREARLRIDRTNTHFWRSQGSEFTPIGVGARDVEPAYPLMKVLNRITGKDSPYAQTIHSVVQELYNGVE